MGYYLKMLIYQRIKGLANEKRISVRELEKELKFSNGTISKWDQRAPSDKLQTVAHYFDVSTDYLLGNTDKRTIEDSDDPNEYYRMDTTGLSPEQIEELKKQIKFAEQLALKNIKKD